MKFDELPVVFKEVGNNNCQLFGVKECIEDVQNDFLDFCKKHATETEEKVEFNHQYAEDVYQAYFKNKQEPPELGKFSEKLGKSLNNEISISLTIEEIKKTKKSVFFVVSGIYEN